MDPHQLLILFLPESDPALPRAPSLWIGDAAFDLYSARCIRPNAGLHSRPCVSPSKALAQLDASVVANLLDLTAHQWSSDHGLVMAGLEHSQSQAVERQHHFLQHRMPPLWRGQTLRGPMLSI